jgi:hypothetical protein
MSAKKEDVLVEDTKLAEQNVTIVREKQGRGRGASSLAFSVYDSTVNSLLPSFPPLLYLRVRLLLYGEYVVGKCSTLDSGLEGYHQD